MTVQSSPSVYATHESKPARRRYSSRTRTDRGSATRMPVSEPREMKCEHRGPLYDPREIRFESGQEVFVLYHGPSGCTWSLGQITTEKPRVAAGSGTAAIYFYQVQYHVGRNNIRKYFAPLNGDIKPNTKDIRRMIAMDKRSRREPDRLV